jgi:hypothetical protein
MLRLCRCGLQIIFFVLNRPFGYTSFMANATQRQLSDIQGLAPEITSRIPEIEAGGLILIDLVEELRPNRRARFTMDFSVLSTGC